MKLVRVVCGFLFAWLASSPLAAQERPAGPTAAELTAALGACATLEGTGRFATDVGRPQEVAICSLRGAFWWRADLDIDCDGGRTSLCHGDPAFQPETSATDSHRHPLDAARLPYVVIPLPSQGFDYRARGIVLGTVVAVIYRDRIVYGVFGDEGPRGIIGEASYALARLLGIDGHPVTGGVDADVTYVVFAGANGAVSRMEDHAQAERIGRARAAELVAPR